MSRITEPGIYDVPADDYHADILCESPTLSNSLIKTLLFRSPKHAWMEHPRLNPNYQPDESSRFDLGSAAHALLLEGNKAKIAIVEADDWRTKAAKEARDLARANGLLPVLAKHNVALQRMVAVAQEAIANCADLSGLTLADGQPEQTIVWQEGDVWCRARADWIASDFSLLIDYKTTDNAEPGTWPRTMANLQGDVQAAWYTRGVAAVTDIVPKFVFMVQEIEPPYAVSFVGMPPAFIALGDEKVTDALTVWDECLTSGQWPAYSNRIHWAEPPPWLVGQYQERQFNQQMEES